jgi:hypothetical protein
VIEHTELRYTTNEVFAEHITSPPAEARSAHDLENQGVPPMSGDARTTHAGHMPQYVLHHRHEAHECGVVYAAFKGHDSPLRHQAAVASCRGGGHEIWWTVDAGSERGALAQLPFFVAERTTASEVNDVEIP